MTALLIAVFGSLGCLLRYLLSGWVHGVRGRGFPYGTLTVNVLGAFLVGFVMELSLRSTLLTARVVSAALLSLVLLAVLYGGAALLFGVRVEGSLAGFLGVAVAFALTTAAFGLLIAALGSTPEATRGLAIFATLVMVLLGGLTTISSFSYETLKLL